MGPKLRLLLSLCLVGCSTEPKPASDLKIVGGAVVNDPTDAAMASTVALMANGGAFCTGTLIGPNHVVTAAHCIDGSSDIQLGYGTNPQPIPGVTVTLARAHPSWTSGPSDVAVLAFDGSLPNGLKPVRIAPMVGIADGVGVLLAGYGVTGESRNGGGILRKVNARIKAFDASVGEFEMQEGLGTGSCYGDSGGPAYVQSASGLTVIGATSRGSNCDYGDGIYGDVRMFQGWFKCTFKEAGKPLRHLLNDSSNEACAPGTIDTDVGGSDARAVFAALGAGDGAGASKIFFAAASASGSANTIDYCLGSIASCSATGAVWVQTNRVTGTTGQELFASPQSLAISAGMTLTTRLSRGTAGTPVLESLTFQPR